MPTTREHVAKADRNATFATGLALKDAAHVEWALTALFYSALHYVEAYLVKIGAPSKNHGQRSRHFSSDPILQAIWFEYSDLKSFGWKSRYEMPDYKPTDVTEEAIPALNTIKEHLQSAVGLELAPDT